MVDLEKLRTMADNLDIVEYRAKAALLRAAADEIEALRKAKWDVQHTDTMNDVVQMGMARDSAYAAGYAKAIEDAAKVAEKWIEPIMATEHENSTYRSIAAAIRALAEKAETEPPISLTQQDLCKVELRRDGEG